jgi:hypothetical protein
MLQFQPEQSTIISSLLRPAFTGFTTSEVGDCRKLEVVQDYCKDHEIEYKKLVILEQIHSVNVKRPDSQHVGVVEQLDECDGAVTNEKNVLLTIRTADCVPVLYYDPVAQVIGASHQGWRGTVKNMVQHMIVQMEELGAHRADTLMAIGPAIGMCCYTVDSDRYVLFMEEMERFEKLIFKPHGDTFHLNLLRLNYELAIENGIASDHIDTFPYCTSCDATRFFSYRRHKQTAESFGEMMGYIMMR